MIGPKLLASVALFLAAASSFKLPAGLDDGFYRVYLDSNGNEIHEPANATMLTPLSKPVPRISKASARTPFDARRSGSLAPRFGQGVLQSWCGCGFNMNPGDCDAAVADIKNQVNIPGQDGVLIPWGMSYYSIRGSVVAFACDDDMSQAGPYGGTHNLTPPPAQMFRPIVSISPFPPSGHTFRALSNSM